MELSEAGVPACLIMYWSTGIFFWDFLRDLQGAGDRYIWVLMQHNNIISMGAFDYFIDNTVERKLLIVTHTCVYTITI